MAILTGRSAFIERLIKQVGVPENALSVNIMMEVGEPVIVTCEFYPEEIKLNDDGEDETLCKEFFLVEVEDDGIQS